MENGLAVLIMAGGKGERFWPRSRPSLPKQFLSLGSQRTLLQETFSRVNGIAPLGMIYVVTPEAYRDLVLSQLPSLPEGNLILEPDGRDTAPCIGLAALRIGQRHPGITLVILPADHFIGDEDRFRSAIAAAVGAAQTATIVLLGVTPTRPEVGYGYIECGEAVGGAGAWMVRRVERFVEKPSPERALGFLKAGNHLWNCGVFAVRLPVLMELFQMHLPRLSCALERIAASLGSELETRVIHSEFASLESISFDYGVVEKAHGCVVIPVDFPWDDVGSWPAVERILEKDSDGNVTHGVAEAVECSGCILYGLPPECGRLVIAYGVKDILVVESGDVTLVADKRRSAGLKRVLQVLRERGLGRYVDGNGAQRNEASTIATNDASLAK